MTDMIFQLLTRAVPRLAIMALLSCGCRDKRVEGDHSGSERLKCEPVNANLVPGQYEGVREHWEYIRLTLGTGGTGSVVMVNPMLAVTNSGALEWHIEDGVIKISAAVPGERHMEARPYYGREKGRSTEYMQLSIHGYDYVIMVPLIRSELLTSLRDLKQSQLNK